jgi:hypothetical protein
MYEIRARDDHRHSFEASGTDAEELIRRAKAYALERGSTMSWETDHTRRIEKFPSRIREAHAHSSGHRLELLASDVCGCFYCLAIYSPTEIVDWTDDVTGQGQTALCAKCGIDGVIGNKSVFPVTAEFLTEMNRCWLTGTAAEHAAAPDGTGARSRVPSRAMLSLTRTCRR